MKRILLVEDDHDIAEVITFTLEKAGFQVMKADSAEVALELFRFQKPDLVLSDFKMPGMDGDDFARTIREENPHIPIIILSGFSGELDELPVNFILNKPVDQTRLLQLVQRLLDVA